MKHFYISLISTFILTGCVVVPEKDARYENSCEISSDRKTLKIVDLAKETNSYYSISGAWLFPLTGVVSGTYVAANNVYHLGEETIVCR